MRVMVIGGGGREHAIVKKLRQSPRLTALFALPGNGGMAADAVCVDIGAKDIEGMVRFAAEQRIDFAVVAPDDPLVLGAVDALEAAGVRCFGPRANAAILEGSKVFAKSFMARHGIPTAACAVFDDRAAALAYLETAPLPAVVKADGLALGKGVVIAETRAEAAEAVEAMMGRRVFGESGARVVIEEFLTGPEVSVLAFTDGETVVPMVSAMDHKRAGDGDTGPNTGGMGVVAPNPYYTEAVAAACMETIFLPTVRGMAAEGRVFRGCLYFGLMLTADGPRVIEYNCRFGDPETQAVLPLLETDLLDCMTACADGTLAAQEVRFSGDAVCCVVLASAGYPVAYETGFPISVGELEPGVEVACAGVTERDGALLTAGGRVLGVSARAATTAAAVEAAYRAAERVQFANKFCRRDIGRRALAARGE